MANDIKEIGDVVKKCKILLLDIEGTTTSISFVKDKLFPYAEENVKVFLDSQWEEDDVKEAVTALKKIAIEDKENSVDGVVNIPGEDASKEDQIEGLVQSVKWQMSADRKAGPLKQLQGLIWKQGYDKGDIKGHVYHDVSPALEQWRSVDGQKVYIYSSGSVQAQKLLFGQSLAGDLLRFIDGHFDTAVGAKQDAASYAAIVEKIGCKSDEILFLTDIVKEGEAARASGLQVALVSRSGNAPLSEEAAAAFPVLHSLAQLTPSNKRKPDAQVQEEIPAKVPKTDAEDDVKTAAENNISETNNGKDVNVKEPEKMDVEEETIVSKEESKEVIKTEDTKKDGSKLVDSKDEEAKKLETINDETKPGETKKQETPIEETKKEETKTEETKIEEPKKDLPMQVETIVEEVTDLAGVADIPVCDVEPVVLEENEQKTVQKETDKMETDSSENVQAASDSKVEVKNSEGSVPVAEESLPTTPIITEIDEMSNDKQSLSEVAEIIEDLEPVVEEPTAVEDMEELQSVGEVLEKECDEILSKVQDVTNLDNIPLKPLLNTIAEENMETENIDSNDIVERILDTELELEMKTCGEIDLNTVQEISEAKPGADEGKIKKDEITTEPKPMVEEKPSDSAVDEKKEEKVKECSPADKLVEETKVEKDKELVEKPEPEKPAEQSKPDTEALKESKESSSVSEESKESEIDKTENEVKETHVNGKTTNGDADTSNLNGDTTSKDEELSSRLSVENGKEVVNGSNGDSNEVEQGQGDNKEETDVSDIKVKTVATDETRNDPKEQPTEA